MLLTFCILLFILIGLLYRLLLSHFFLIFHMLLGFSFPFFLIGRLQFFFLLSMVCHIDSSGDVLIVGTLLLFDFKGAATPTQKKSTAKAADQRVISHTRQRDQQSWVEAQVALLRDQPRDFDGLLPQRPS